MPRKSVGFREGDEVVLRAVVTRVGEDNGEFTQVTVRITGVGVPVTVMPSALTKVASGHS